MTTLNLGTLLVKLKADTSDFVKGIKGSEKATLKFADGVNLAMGGVAVDALKSAGTAMLKFGMDSINAASDSEEAWSKFAVVFKDDAASVEAQLDAIATSSGLSTNQLVGFASTLGDTFVPLGFTTEAAGDLSSQVTQLAVDLASFNNLNTADVVRDFQSALVGNTETLRKYGIVASIATIKEEALAAGLWDGTGALDAQAKASAILNIAMAGTADAQGDAERTAEGFANQSKALEASILDLQIELGQGLLPTAIDIVKQLNVIAEKAMPAVKAATGDYEETLSDIILANLQAAETTGELAEEFLKMQGAADITGATVLGFSDDLGQGMSDAAVKMLVLSSSYDDLLADMDDAGIEQDAFIDSLGDLAFEFGMTNDKFAATLENLRIYARVAAEAESADMLLGQTIKQTAEEIEEATFAARDYTDQIDFEAIAELDLAMAAETARLAIEEKALADEAAALAAVNLAAATETARLALSGYFVEALNATEPTTNLALSLFETAANAGISAESMAILAIATGEFTQAEIDAAFQAALMQANIDMLVDSMLSGALSAENAAEAVLFLADGQATTATEAIALASALNAPNADLMAMETLAKGATSALNAIPKTIKVRIKTDMSQFAIPGKAAAQAFAEQQAGQGGGEAEFALGGFTGYGEGFAGMVHANEFVFSPPAVAAIGIPALNAMHDMAKGGGLSQAGGVSVGEMNINAAPGMDEQELARGVNVQLGTLLRQSTRSGAGLMGTR